MAWKRTYSTPVMRFVSRRSWRQLSRSDKMARPEPNIFSQKCGKACAVALTSISTLCEVCDVCERTDGPEKRASTVKSAIRIWSLRFGRIKIAPPKGSNRKRERQSQCTFHRALKHKWRLKLNHVVTVIKRIRAHSFRRDVWRSDVLKAFTMLGRESEA